jgi:phosphomannomutase
MHEPIRQDILSMLKDAMAALKRKDAGLLREVSDHTLHNASIYQDKDSISVAVVMYALSKTLGRMPSDKPDISDLLSKAYTSLEKGDLEQYQHNIKRIMESVSAFDQEMNLYIQKVIDEAEIKKGSRIYEHGISLAQTAELLGVSQWELMKYLGQTKIADGFEEEYPLSERISHARRLFGL